MAKIPLYKKLPKNGKKGELNLKQFYKKKGIYRIFENGNLIYIGYSGTNLYKTISRHFHIWKDSKQQARISYSNLIGKRRYDIEVELMPQATTNQIELRECQLVDFHQPRDNKLIVDKVRGRSKLDYCRKEVLVVFEPEKPEPPAEEEEDIFVPF